MLVVRVAYFTMVSAVNFFNMGVEMAVISLVIAMTHSNGCTKGSVIVATMHV